MARADRSRPWAIGLGLASCLGLLALLALDPGQVGLGLAVVAGVAVAVAVAYAVWHVDPAWTLTGALLLSAFSGHWGAFGVPAFVAPDRFLLVAGIAVLLLRGPAARDRPPLRIRPVHWLLAATVLYAVGSAIAVETIAEYDSVVGLADRLAVPFAVFLLAPYAFRTARQRQFLLGGFVAFGGYLGVTSLLETVGPKSLIVPPFITDTSIGIHEGRARGPFLESAVNGFGLYVCLVAAAIGVSTWRAPRWRLAAGAVALLCTLGLLFSLTRSVWLAAGVATLLTMIVVRELRRYLVPVAAAGLVLVVAALALVPGLQEDVTERANTQRSIWDRENSNAAALEMVESSPLLGIGHATFTESSADYLRFLDDIPQTNADLVLHNVFLSFASELGLIGLTLFVLSFALAIGGAIFTRGPPELYPWRVGLLAIAIAWLVIASFVPFGSVFANLLPWLWAGVVVGGSREAEPAANGRSPERLSRPQRMTPGPAAGVRTTTPA